MFLAEFVEDNLISYRNLQDENDYFNYIILQLQFSRKLQNGKYRTQAIKKSYYSIEKRRPK